MTRDQRRLILQRLDSAASPCESDILELTLTPPFTERPLVAGPGRDFHPAISPDGRWLVWARGSIDTAHLVIAPYSELSRERRLPLGNASDPVWSADGRTLYYFDRSRRRVMAASVEGGAEARVGVPRAMTGPLAYTSSYAGRNYDVAAAGRVHAASQVADADSLQLRDLAVYANWEGALRAAVRLPKERRWGRSRHVVSGRARSRTPGDHRPRPPC